MMGMFFPEDAGGLTSGCLRTPDKSARRAGTELHLFRPQFSSKQPSRDQLLHTVQPQHRILLQKVGARLLL
jgi:hypothetical protein